MSRDAQRFLVPSWKQCLGLNKFCLSFKGNYNTTKQYTNRNTFFCRLCLFCLSFIFIYSFFEPFAKAESYNTPNFIVFAETKELAQKIGYAAEATREKMALLWLGMTLPQWSHPCEVNVTCSQGLAAGGETVFKFSGGEVYDWKMRIQGSEERILDSVLPHEITHTILASYLREPAPRWIDEGMATSVESIEERNKYRSMLIDFLHTERGIAFNNMVSMEDYPNDLTPFYSQAFSICEYLIMIGGRLRLIEFTKKGSTTKDWKSALQEYYNCESLGDLQLEWLDWVRRWEIAEKPVDLPPTRKMPTLLSIEKADEMVHNINETRQSSACLNLSEDKLEKMTTTTSMLDNVEFVTRGQVSSKKSSKEIGFRKTIDNNCTDRIMNNIDDKNKYDVLVLGAGSATIND